MNYKTGGSHWVMDSGCTHHMTGDHRMFTSLDEGADNGKITFGDSSNGKVKGLGKIAISNDLSISNVLLVETLDYNLLSVAQICDLGLRCTFDVEKVVVTSSTSNDLMFQGFRHGNLYLVDFSSNEASLRTCFFTKRSLGWLWHRRLGHVSMSQLKKLTKHDMVVGVKDVIFEKDKPCSACQAGKQVGSSHPMKSFVSTSRPLELLHMDLFGPTTYKSIGGNKFCLVIVDDYSRYTWTFFLVDKSEVHGIFKKFAKRAQNEYSTTIVKIRSDNGTEFKNTQIDTYCDEVGIKHELSSSYTPQQ